MHRFTRHIFLVFFLHFSVVTMAQQDEWVRDSVMQFPPPPMEEMGEEETSSFSTISQTAPVAVRKVPQEKVKTLQNEDAYWYANKEPEKKKEENKPESRGSGLLDLGWFQNLLWIIILCSFIGVVIWYLASSNIQLFRRDAKKIIEEESEEEITDDIFSIPYEREIQRATEAQNYRLAIRLWYLKTLKELSERNIIDYRFGKTNNDYVNSLFGNRSYKDFFRLTRNFEYTWYGQFNLSAQAYEMMRADFIQFKNSLS
jgi:hypothetical protein